MSTPAPALVTPDAAIAAPGLGWLASDGAALWVLTVAGEVARIDPATNAIGPLTPVVANHDDGGFGANAQGLWLNDFNENLVVRIDPASLEVVASIPAGQNPEGVAVDPENGAIWIANHRGASVDRIDPSTNKVVASIDVGHVGPSGPHQIALGLGSVWVGVPNSLAIYRIDPLANAIVATIDVPMGASACGGFAFSEAAVWTSSCFDAPTLMRIDPATNKVVAVIQLGGYGDDPVMIDGSPWLIVEAVTPGPGLLVHIDPSTNTIDRTITLGDDFVGGNLVVAFGSVWVTDPNGGQVLRLPLSAFAE
jgi:YVTN family beta-propeller protein